MTDELAKIKKKCAVLIHINSELERQLEKLKKEMSIENKSSLRDGEIQHSEYITYGLDQSAHAQYKTGLNQKEDTRHDD